MSTLTDNEVVAVSLQDDGSRVGRILANVVSVLFHPLFVPVYVTAFLMYLHPLLFAGYNDGSKWRLLATVWVNLVLFPAVTVFLCWRLKFITSVKMEDRRDRIIPLAASMIFYFWGWYVLRNFAEVPDLFKQFLLGSFITIIAGWLVNIYAKISLHALGAGGLLAFVAVVVYSFEGGSGQYLVIAALVAGMICSARLYLRAHSGAEVVLGFLVGALSQIIAVFSLISDIMQLSFLSMDVVNSFLGKASAILRSAVF